MSSAPVRGRGAPSSRKAAIHSPQVSATPVYVPAQYPVNAAPPTPYYYAGTGYYPMMWQPPVMSYGYHNYAYMKPKNPSFSPKGYAAPPPMYQGVVPYEMTVPYPAPYYPNYAANYSTSAYASPSSVANDAAAQILSDMEGSGKRERSPQVPPPSLDVRMSVDELHKAILKHFEQFGSSRLSWLNRMLAKCNSAVEFRKCLQIFELYQTNIVEVTPETCTLLVKAACRAGLPEKALDMLKRLDEFRLFPTLGGIHYLMINFSLKKDTKAVMEVHKVTKLRNIEPTQRTYHILIRECVDNGLINDAMNLASECLQQGIVPSRVAYNILMNGCRKFNMPNQILELRQQMEQKQVEINETTVKFTSLAHMMLGDATKAVAEFTSYLPLAPSLEEFCQKFFEVAEENDVGQLQCVVNLFEAVQKEGHSIPASVSEQLANLKKQIVELSSKSAPEPTKTAETEEAQPPSEETQAEVK